MRKDKWVGIVVYQMAATFVSISKFFITDVSVESGHIAADISADSFAFECPENNAVRPASGRGHIPCSPRNLSHHRKLLPGSHRLPLTPRSDMKRSVFRLLPIENPSSPRDYWWRIWDKFTFREPRGVPRSVPYNLPPDPSRLPDF